MLRKFLKLYICISTSNECERMNNIIVRVYALCMLITDGFVDFISAFWDLYQTISLALYT